MTEKSKNDVFVGNLTFNTTEDHLREKFSFIGNGFRSRTYEIIHSIKQILYI